MAPAVAGTGKTNGVVKPADFRALATANLRAKWTELDRAYGGSPLALERNIPTGFGASLSRDT